MPDRNRVADAPGRRRLGAVLPRPRGGARRGDDPRADLPGRVLEGRRPHLRRTADAEPLELTRARDRQPLLPDRDPGPARGRHRLRDEVPGRGRGRGELVRGGRDERGRLARGPQFRSDPPAPRRVHLREQRVRDQRAAVEADGRGRRREPCRGLRDARRGRGRERRAGVLPRDEGGARPSTRRGRPDPDRVQDVSVPPPHLR